MADRRQAEETETLLEVVAMIVRTLTPLTAEQRLRVLRTVCSWLDIHPGKVLRGRDE
jgi:hypothetical protein